MSSPNWPSGSPQPPPGPHYPGPRGQPHGHHAPYQHPWPHPYPAAPTTSSLWTGTLADERLVGVFAHLGMFVFPVVLPIIIYATSPADQKPFQRAAAVQAAALQLSSWAFGFLVVFLPMILVTVLVFSRPTVDPGLIQLVMFAPFLLLLVCPALAIRAALRCHAGRAWRAPIVGGLAERFAAFPPST